MKQIFLKHFLKIFKVFTCILSPADTVISSVFSDILSNVASVCYLLLISQEEGPCCQPGVTVNKQTRG